MSSLEILLVTQSLFMKKRKKKKERICVWQNIQDPQQHAINYVKYIDHILDI
jgi:hypothetical protein